MKVSLELYKTFYYVARNNSVTLAADDLLISQPAVSKAIKTLEEQLEVSLFVRERNGVILTEDGERLFSKIKPAIELIEAGENEILDRDNTVRTITIGTSKVFMQHYLMPIIDGYHKKYPNVKLKFVTNNTKDLIKGSQNGIIDAVFLNLPTIVPSDFKTIKLLQIHDCFVANNTFKQYKGKKFSDKDLSKLPLLLIPKGSNVRNFLDSYCASHNIKLNPEMEFSSYNLIQQFTMNGYGVGMLYEEFLTKEFESGELFKLDIDCKFDDRHIGLIYPENKEYNHTVMEFIDYVKKNK